MEDSVYLIQMCDIAAARPKRMLGVMKRALGSYVQQLPIAFQTNDDGSSTFAERFLVHPESPVFYHPDLAPRKRIQPFYIC